MEASGVFDTFYADPASTNVTAGHTAPPGSVSGPHMTLSRTASPASGPPPLTTTFSYWLVNDGTDSLFHTAVTDDGCSPVSYRSGDVDQDLLLDPGESWSFACSRTFPSPGTYQSTAGARATSTQTGLGVTSNAVSGSVSVA